MFTSEELLYSEVLTRVELEVTKEVGEDVLEHLSQHGYYVRLNRHIKKDFGEKLNSVKNSTESEDMIIINETLTPKENKNEDKEIRDTEKLTSKPKDYYKPDVVEAINDTCNNLKKVIMETKLAHYEKLLNCISSKTGMFFYIVSEDNKFDVIEQSPIRTDEYKRDMADIDEILQTTDQITIFGYNVVSSFKEIRSIHLTETLEDKVIELMWKHFTNRRDYIELRIKFLKISLGLADIDSVTLNELNKYKQLQNVKTISNNDVKLKPSVIFKDGVDQALKECYNGNKTQSFTDKLKNVVEDAQSLFNNTGYFIRNVRKVNVDVEAPRNQLNKIKKILVRNCRGSLIGNKSNFSTHWNTDYYIY